MPETNLRAYLKLHLADGVGALIFRRLVEHFGGAATAAAAGSQELLGVEGVGGKTAEAITSVTDEQVEAELAEAKRRGVTMFTAEDQGYPKALLTIYDYPPVLYVLGRLEDADALAFGVVGARRCAHYGLEQAERFGELLGRAGFTVVSGGARGIDTAAHRGALAAGGRTIAVMGCGLAQLYPPENAKLFESIASDGRGAIVSELPMLTTVLAGNFHTRNRIISGLLLGVLVVEAARRSGSLITARLADEQGRAVFALPGRVDSPTSQGANELIRDGATLVQNLEDILEQLGTVGEKMTPQPEQGSPVTPAHLTDAESKLLGALSEGALSLDELVRRTGIDSAKAAASMTMLVIKGAVAQQPGSLFVRKHASRCE